MRQAGPDASLIMHTKRQGSATSLFAQPDDEVPPSNPFENVGAQLRQMEPSRVASLVENALYSPQSVTRVTRDFSAHADDIIVSTNPRTGDRLVIRVIRLINARDSEEFDQVAQEKSNAGVPWIESVFVNGDPELFGKDQPGTRRLFKSHMAHQGLQVRRKNAPLFVSTVRHPMDVTLSWYRYIRACYQRHNDVQAFDAAFSADAFANVQATTAQIMPTAKILTMEHIMLDWYRESRENKRVHVVFFEQLVTDPARVIAELADFLQTGLTPERVEKIVRIIRAEGLLPSAGAAASSDGGRARADTLTDGSMFSYDSVSRMWDRWHRALESTKLGDDVGRTYEEFYRKATGEEYPFAKVTPDKPLKHGPLDELGRSVENMGKSFLGRLTGVRGGGAAAGKKE